MADNDWQVLTRRADFDQLRSAPRLPPLIALAKTINALRFAQGTLTRPVEYQSPAGKPWLQGSKHDWLRHPDHFSLKATRAFYRRRRRGGERENPGRQALCLGLPQRRLLPLRWAGSLSGCGASRLMTSATGFPEDPF